MNQAVRSWNRWQQRRKPDLPDSVEVDGEKIIMAERKNPQTEPVLDNTSKEVEAKRIVELPKNQFNNIIRALKVGTLGQVNAVRQMTFDTLKRLKVDRDISKAVEGIPKGSDQFDAGSFRDWMAKVTENDMVAVAQIIIIDATAVARSVT